MESIVVLTNPDLDVEGADHPLHVMQKRKSNLTLSSISDLIVYLKEKEKVKKVFNLNQVNIIGDYLNKLNNPKNSTKYQVAGYETIEYISQSKEYFEIVARPLLGRKKGLTRFRVFRPSLIESKIERERFIHRAYNTLDSVSKIGDHPNIQKVTILQNDEGDIIESSEWSETGSVRDYLQRENDVVGGNLSKEICLGITRALIKSHEAGIIHRVLKPENVLLLNGIPKLINFDLSYQDEENRMTVITDLGQLQDDGYIAPEMLEGHGADEGTDYFSLGVIAYELFTGKRPFVSSRAFKAGGGTLGQEEMALLQGNNVPFTVIEALRRMIIADPAKRLKDGEEILNVLGNGIRDQNERVADQRINQVLLPGARFDLFEIQEPIGEGAEAQIYKAETLKQRTVAIKMFNREIPWLKIQREAEIAASIKSSYVVNCDGKLGHWNQERFFIVMDYIPGRTLREHIENQERPDLELFRTVCLCLFEAVKAFHHHRDEEGSPHPYLHGDIKPDNILITNDNKPVLIDFGLSGEPRIEAYQGSTGYIAPDTIKGLERQYSEDGDLYALGVTLWEWYFGTKPFLSPSVLDYPAFPEEITCDEGLKIWFGKAVGTEYDRRFRVIEEMEEEYSKAFKPSGGSIRGAQVQTPNAEELLRDDPEVEAKPFEGNPFVAYLNSLSSSSAGNENATAESQVNNPFYKKILVESPLFEFVYQTIVEERKNVILTGNAGDGKTTIAIELIQKILGSVPALSPKEVLPKAEITIVKDMSELSATDQETVLQDACQSQDMKYLIISNTGTLLSSFTRLDPQMHSKLLEAMEASHPQNLMDGKFIIINIGRVDSIGTAIQVFQKMMAEENWRHCAECECRDSCVIYNNVRNIQDNLETVKIRVELLYQRLYAYGFRLTLRQMIGHLAYSITGGQGFESINNMSQIARRAALTEYAFNNLFFGDNGEIQLPNALQLYPVLRIQKEQFGSMLDPYFEREFMVKDKIDSFLTSGVVDCLKYLSRENGRLLDSPSSSAIRKQKRRLFYFYGQFDREKEHQFLITFLNSPMLLKYQDYCQSQGLIRHQARGLRNRVLHVLQEFFIGMRLPENGLERRDLYITMHNIGGGAGTQMILGTLRSEDFDIKVRQKFAIGSQTFNSIYLIYKDRVELELDLPFLDYVYHRREGELVQELSAYYANRLKRFKVQLLDHQERKERDALELLEIRQNRDLRKMTVEFVNGTLEV